jgi:hypothetical protein
MVAESSAAVVIQRSQVVSFINAIAPIAPTGAGLFATGSAVHAFETLFQGTNINPCCTGSNPGGNGMTLVASTLYAAGSTFRGGQGQVGFNDLGFCLGPGGRGGAGLDAGQALEPPVILDCTFVGGPKATLCGGAVGPPVVGSIEDVDLPLRSYELSTPVRGGTSYQLTAHCEPGEFVWSVFSPVLDPAYVPNYFGTQVGVLPVTLVFEGVADGTGSLVKSVPVPPLAGLTTFERLYGQGLFFDALNNAYLGSPSVLVVVN